MKAGVSDSKNSKAQTKSTAVVVFVGLVFPGTKPTWIIPLEKTNIFTGGVKTAFSMMRSAGSTKSSEDDLGLFIIRHIWRVLSFWYDEEQWIENCI